VHAQAVRQGWWLLLDEVNLASQETLQRLSGLLEDQRGTVSLTERGDVEAVARHPDFRLFAAMNPPTDVGKKDLAPSLRARFTELYVEDVEARDDLLVIAEDCLRPVLHLEPPREELVGYYLEARALANESLVDGAGQRPRYSLRTWCRALRYANELVRLKYKLRRALFEGLCMSFCTQLDSTSAALMEEKALKMLGLKHSDTRNPPPCPGHETAAYVLVETFWLARGPLPLCDRSEASASGHVSFVIVPSVRRHLGFLARAVLSARFPVLLQGPTSSGKTSMVEYLAARTGHRCLRINNHEHTDLQEYSGTYVPDDSGRLVFQEGALVEAMRGGYWVILDELNLAPSEVRAARAAGAFAAAFYHKRAHVLRFTRTFRVFVFALL
jgi:midasin